MQKPVEVAIDRIDRSPAYIACVGVGWFPKTPGGLDRYVYELTYHLAANQDRVELYALDLPEEQPDFPVKLFNLGSQESPLWQRLWKTRSRFLHKGAEAPDAINLHFALYSLPLLPMMPKGVPVTFTFHGPWALESQQEGTNKLSVWSKQWLVENTVYRRVNRFIVLSQAFGKILHQQYQVPESKIHVIPGGVDLERFRPSLSRQEARAQLTWPQDRVILFTTRRLVRRMGLDKLLSALAQSLKRLPDVWLAIAGLGPQKELLEQQVRELGLNDHVRFLGYLPDWQLPLAYQAADLSVMPSQSLEGFGLTLLESLACGTPAMCTPVGGMPEVLAGLSPNLIATSSDVSPIAERIQQLLLGEMTMPSRAACREYAQTNFDWHKIAQQVRQVLLAD